MLSRSIARAFYQAAAQGRHERACVGKLPERRAAPVRSVRAYGEFDGCGSLTVRGLVHYLCRHDRRHLAGMQWLLGKIDAARSRARTSRSMPTMLRAYAYGVARASSTVPAGPAREGSAADARREQIGEPDVPEHLAADAIADAEHFLGAVLRRVDEHAVGRLPAGAATSSAMAVATAPASASAGSSAARPFNA
jgi:hypothetical protein